MADNINNISDEQLAAFLDGNVSESEFSDILSRLDSDCVSADIVALSPSIDFEVARRNLPMRALAAANRRNLCSFDCEMDILGLLGHDVDHWSLLETAKANNWLRDEGTPLHHVGRLLELKGLHVVRKYDATLRDLGEAVGSGRYVIAIVDRAVLNGDEKACGPMFHAVRVARVGDGVIDCVEAGSADVIEMDSERFAESWKCSGCYMVSASESLSGYNPCPINVDDIDLDADLIDLTEAIAENAHDIWARARMDEGWTYGPVRDDAAKKHPDLVPYAMLPDSEKEYDRIMAMNTLRLVRRLGFDIVNH